MTQLAAMPPSWPQFAAPDPAAASPPPRTAPMIECVVDTGAPKAVARLSQMAAASSAAVISQMKRSGSVTASGRMMPFWMVETTSPPAMSAPAASNTAAMISAPTIDIAFDPTAGPTLLATSLAPMFMAM